MYIWFTKRGIKGGLGKTKSSKKLGSQGFDFMN